MTTRTEMIVGFTEAGVSATSGADTLINSINQNQQNFTLVNSAGQVVAAVVGAIPALKPVTIQANTVAATMTFLQIIVDINDGKSVNTGDVLNLVGNVAGIVGTVAFFAGAAPSVVLVASAISIVTASAGVLSGDNMTLLKNWASGFVRTYWESPPIYTEGLKTFYINSTGGMGTYNELLGSDDFGVIIVRPGREPEFAKMPPPQYYRAEDDVEVDGDGGY